MSRSLSRYIMHVTTNVVKMYFVFFKISVARAFHAQALVPPVPPSAHQQLTGSSRTHRLSPLKQRDKQHSAVGIHTARHVL